MWLTILSNNFKDLLDTFKSKPLVIISIALMFLAGFFINKWVVSKDDNFDEIKARVEEINIVRDSMYNYKYEALYYKKLYEENKNKTDSLFIEANRVLRPIIESKTN